LVKKHEDEFTTYKIIYKSKKVVFTTKQLLYYWQRPDSIMGAGFNVQHRLHALQAYAERAEFFNILGLDSFRDKTYKRQFYIYKDIIENKKALSELSNREELVAEFNNLRYILREGKHNLTFKVGYELYYTFPSMMKIIFNIYKMIKHRITKSS